MKNKELFYLRTEVFCGGEKLIAGGSVAHTFGVIEGFLFHGYANVIAASVMLEQLSEYNTKN